MLPSFNRAPSSRTPIYWARILRAFSRRIDSLQTVQAVTFLGHRDDCATHPVQVRGTDGNTYMVKGCENERCTINEQIVGSLGRRIGAPVADITMVHVSRDLIAMNPEMRHVRPGPAHASLWLDGCSDREWYTRTEDAENDGRHARLAVLFGWLVSNDPQAIYRNAEPRLVFSVDHGNFFPGGPSWTITSLAAAAPPALDSDVMATCRPSRAAVKDAGTELRSVSDIDIANAVALPPEECAIEFEERIALCEFVAARRDELAFTIAASH